RNHQLFESLEVEVRDVLGAERAQAAANADRRRSLYEPCVRDGAQLRRQQDAEQPRLGLPHGADRRRTVRIPPLAGRSLLLVTAPQQRTDDMRKRSADGGGERKRAVLAAALARFR